MTPLPPSQDRLAEDVPNVVPVVGRPRLIPVWHDDELAGYALVDPDTARAASDYRWELDQGYAVTTINGDRTSLHRVVLGLRPRDGIQGHHVNGQRLDCRRANLLAVTPAEHALAHNMLPSQVAVGAYQPIHPAVKRGHARWLEEYRLDRSRPKFDPTMSESYQTGKRRRELPKTLTVSEVEALMRMPNLRCPTGLRDRCILMLMHRCGLRVAETVGIYLRDVRWAEGQIDLRADVAKGGREAVVYMDKATQAMLERWIDERRKHAAGRPHLFTTLKGGPIGRREVYGMVRRRGRKAGIEKNVHPHMLRHTFATELLREGFNLREVQHLMRHADIRTTVLYTHLFDSELADKIRSR